VKQALQDNAKKLNNPITAYTTDKILAQEVQEKENIKIAKDIF
jgi:ribosomal protein S17E